MELELFVGVAKTGKYATSESGDSVEVIERPHGGISLVLADGQRSGKSAKLISNIAVRKAISLLADGVRDGAAGRAANDYLRTHRQGKVSAEMVMISADLRTRTLVISRNTHCPVYIANSTEIERLLAPSRPLGFYSDTKPAIVEFPFQPGLTVVAFSDGLLAAGSRRSRQLQLEPYLLRFQREGSGRAQALADELLTAALDLDEGRPVDDITLVVVSLVREKVGQKIRRLSVLVPL